MKFISFVFCVLSLPVFAEDWTVNGKDYHNVTVGQVDADRVHITYDGGIGTVMLADLPPELQKKFNYDPAAAKAATDAEAQREAQSDAIRQAASAQELTAQTQEQSLQNRLMVWGTVMEKMPDGLLVRCLGNFIAGAPGMPSKMLSQDPHKVYGICFLKNYAAMDSIVDGSPIKVLANSAGPYSYTATDGSVKTIPSYSASQ